MNCSKRIVMLSVNQCKLWAHCWCIQMNNMCTWLLSMYTHELYARMNIVYTNEQFEHELESLRILIDISIYYSFIESTSDRWRCSCPVNFDLCSLWHTIALTECIVLLFCLCYLVFCLFDYFVCVTQVFILTILVVYIAL